MVRKQTRPRGIGDALERMHAVTDMHTQPGHRETGFDQRTLARVAGEITELPAVATQDWVDQAATALTGIDPWCRVGMAIATLEPNGQVHVIEAVGAGVSEKEREQLTDPKADMLGLRVRLERMTDLGITLPDAALRRGLAAVCSDLGPWRDGPLSRVWNPAGVEKLLIGIVPIGKGEPNRSLLVFVALGHAPNGSTRANARTLGALLPLLAQRVRKALPAEGPISWMTDREQDVLERLILGRSVREIAEELGRSPHTVHDHVKSLHRKLDASSRGELVARALGHGTREKTELDPVVIERVRAAAQIEPTPGTGAAARRPG